VIVLRGKLKNDRLYIGKGIPFVEILPLNGEMVKIVDSENHYAFGKRYKIEGRDEWFEESCFEFIHLEKEDLQCLKPKN
jgi:hypothetical protein